MRNLFRQPLLYLQPDLEFYAPIRRIEHCTNNRYSMLFQYVNVYSKSVYHVERGLLTFHNVAILSLVLLCD